MDSVPLRISCCSVLGGGPRPDPTARDGQVPHPSQSPLAECSSQPDVADGVAASERRRVHTPPQRRPVGCAGARGQWSWIVFHPILDLSAAGDGGCGKADPDPGCLPPFRLVCNGRAGLDPPGAGRATTAGVRRFCLARAWLTDPSCRSISCVSRDSSSHTHGSLRAGVGGGLAHGDRMVHPWLSCACRQWGSGGTHRTIMCVGGALIPRGRAPGAHRGSARSCRGSNSSSASAPSARLAGRAPLPPSGG